MRIVFLCIVRRRAQTNGARWAKHKFLKHLFWPTPAHELGQWELCLFLLKNPSTSCCCWNTDKKRGTTKRIVYCSFSSICLCFILNVQTFVRNILVISSGLLLVRTQTQTSNRLTSHGISTDCSERMVRTRTWSNWMEGRFSRIWMTCRSGELERHLVALPDSIRLSLAQHIKLPNAWASTLSTNWWAWSRLLQPKSEVITCFAVFHSQRDGTRRVVIDEMHFKGEVQKLVSSQRKKSWPMLAKFFMGIVKTRIKGHQPNLVEIGQVVPISWVGQIM